MTSRLLVTGASGFVGGHLLAAVKAGDFGSEVQPIAWPSGKDLRDELAVAAFVSESGPTDVIHLAAQSFVPRAIAQPKETYEINVIGTLNLLEALSASGFKGRFLYVSSGDVYGRVALDSLPVDHVTVPCPGNPYASSKLAAEELCLQWGRRTGRDVLIARPFNHIGPGQSADFVVSSLAHQVVAIKQGRQSPVIDVGDIEATRDFTDVRDVVAAYAAILASGRPQRRYLVGSGVERTVAQVLQHMQSLAGTAAEVRVDPARLRPSDQRRMVADATQTTLDTGWRPKIEFDQTLNDILTSVRNK
ncbi:GDP-mannose 4,6-dehydratase [Xanthomonas indica]|uniref:GDP-mannose 4,6-dehydratase n=1 Tax=Xanthomonas indica TaxID=2912242 RepID=A0AAU8I8T1_9XANT|nr:GDP-mannose 4,6-dehydratase [Xanthomonas indica]MCI2261672.1 GDP-mannose 4,6-dehydratase [Xanthomonas indica]